MTKITIITACMNSVSTIENAVNSVLTQTCPELEYIVIDGGSTDGTMDVLNKYRSRITTLISEQDGGIYHALNKGIGRATGEIIGFLHADDFYNADNVLLKVVNAFNTYKTDCVFGDLQYVQKENSKLVIRNWIAGKYTEGLFLKGWMPPHPSFFLKREVYKKYGTFNTELSISADYELMLRMMHKHKITAHYLPEVLVKMRSGGKSNKTIGSRIKANREDRKAWKINNLKPGFLTLIRKPLRKIGQFL